MQRSAKAALFFSGLFCGGAVDHAILALRGATRTPYGLRTSVRGNWAFAALDAALAAASFAVYWRRS